MCHALLKKNARYLLGVFLLAYPILYPRTPIPYFSPNTPPPTGTFKSGITNSFKGCNSVQASLKRSLNFISVHLFSFQITNYEDFTSTSSVRMYFSNNRIVSQSHCGLRRMLKNLRWTVLSVHTRM